MSNISQRINALSPQKRALLLERLQAQAPAIEREAPRLPTIEPDPDEREQPFPLLTVQEVYLLGRSGAFDLSVYGANIYMEQEIAGISSLVQPFVLRAVETALNRLIKRHDVLRLIVLPDGRQQVLPQVPHFPLKIVSLRGKSPQAVAAALDTVREHMRFRKAPLDQWPLFEARAHRLDDRILLHFRFESLLMDGRSRIKLMNELFQVVENLNMPLPAIECSFRDFAVTWNAFQTVDNDSNLLYRRARDYWLQRLPALPPPPALPLATPLTPETPARFVTWIAELLDHAAWTRLKARAARSGLSPSGVGTAAFIELLRRWNTRPDFTLSLESTYRPLIHPDMVELIANFNTIHLLEVQNQPGTFEARAQRVQQQIMVDLERRDFSGHEVLREWNRRLHGGARAATLILFNSVIEYGHASYTFKRIGDAQAEAGTLNPSSSPPSTLSLIRMQFSRIGRYAVRQLFRVYQQKAPAPPRIQEIEGSLYAPQILMLPTLIEDDQGRLLCKWHVVEEAFPPGLVRDVADVFTEFLRRLADDESCWQDLTPHSFLPAAQREQRARINNTQTPLPDVTLHSLFMAQAARRPRQAALINGNIRMTYSALARASTSLGAELRCRGVQPNTLVAIVMEHGWEQVVAALGITASGAAFLPIDPALPAAQFRAILEHGEVTLALTQSRLDACLPWPEHVQRLPLDKLPLDRRDAPSAPAPRPDDLAYAIYSSTTARPKSVMIEHRSVVNTILDINQRFKLNAQDRVLALMPLACDLSIYDLFGTLAAGGMIVMPDRAAMRDPAHWAELALREHVTIWNSTPALLQHFIAHVADSPDLHPHSLRLALLSRDWIPVSLPDRIKAIAPQIVVASLGGASEAAIWSSVYIIRAIDSSWKSIPYGRPLTNQQLHVFDPDLAPRPTWVPGQLYIGGLGLARGYWRDDEQTRADFIIHPQTGERLYRTGQWARYLPDGRIELLGHADFQVTIQGYTVEPRQIEAALEQHPALHHVIVLGYEDACGSPGLVAYVVPRQQPGPSLGELRQFLAARFPTYMLPTELVALDALPLTAIDTINRCALPRPNVPASPPPKTFVAPRNPTELKVLRIWEEIFDIRPLGVTDNFFDVGGNSLLAVRLITRLREVFGQDISLMTFLPDATVEHLARMIQAATAAQAKAAAKKASSRARKETAVTEQPATAPQAKVPSMRTFFLIWLGQLISQVGTGLTAFALGVWVFEINRSATQFTLIAFFGMLPVILFSPIAGALVDRWDRKWAMILSDSGAAIGTLLLLGLFATDSIQLWHIYLIVAVSSIFRAFQYPAYSAATTLLVPKEQLARAGGLVQLAQAIGQLISPIAAGFLVGAIGLEGVIAIDLMTFVFALGTLLLARVPRPESSAAGQAARGSLLKESGYGWTYIKQRPGLLGLLIFFAASNFLMGTVIVMSTPLVLSFSSAAALGTVLSVAGLGMVAGSLAMGILGGSRRRVYGVLGGVLLMGMCMVIAGLRPSTVLLGAAAFVFTAGLPIIAASSQAIWQRKVAADVQGRVFAIRSMIATSSMPIAYLVAGPLADYVFEPLLRENGALAGSVGRIIGVGPGRGIGLMFIVLGVLAMLSVVAGYMYPRLRLVEDELPDAIPDAPSAPADGVGPATSPAATV